MAMAPMASGVIRRLLAHRIFKAALRERGPALLLPRLAVLGEWARQIGGARSWLLCRWWDLEADMERVFPDLTLE